jgi:CRP-like cAMP-binding protein
VATVKQALAASEMFKGLTDEELDKVAALGRMEVYERGAPLFVEGAAAENFFIVELGRVALNIGIRDKQGSHSRDDQKWTELRLLSGEGHAGLCTVSQGC